jgi:hypothetical protein
MGLALWGLLVVVIAEGLGSLGGLTQLGVALAWGATSVALLVYLKFSGKPLALPRPAAWLRSLPRPERILLTGLVGVAVILTAIALISPPNNVDSLLYHLPRVRHWAQQGSLDFYPAAYAHQLFMPPWAELTLLQIRLLFGSDRLANLLQLTSFVGCVVGVALLAASLGAGRAGRWLAAAFVASIPIVILEATSTQNDLVVSLWLVILANIALWEYRSGARSKFPWIVGVVVGLGLLTKATFVVYSLPLLAWMLLARLRGARVRPGLMFVGVVVVVGMAINLPHWYRTFQTFGSPFGPKDVVLDHLRLPARGEDSVLGLVRAEFQMIGRNLITPVPQINRGVSAFFEAVPGVFGSESAQDLDQALWNHEDTAGNPLHVALALATISLTLLGWPRGGERVHRSYAIVVLAGYLLLPIVIHAAAATVGAIRYQIPFLVLAAPLVGRAVEQGGSRRLALWAAGLAIFFSLPWVLFNNTRPVIGLSPYVTRTDSLLAATPEESLFAMYAGNLDEYQAITNRIQELGCRQVGLRIDSHDPEYLFWRLLDASPQAVTLENVDPLPELLRYRDPTFRPCAIICTICGSATTLDGLSLDRGYPGINLYVATLFGSP